MINNKIYKHTKVYGEIYRFYDEEKSKVLIIGSSSFIYELLNDYVDKSFEVYKISSKKIKDTYYFNFISLSKSEIKLRSKIFKNINFDLVLIFQSKKFKNQITN